MKERKACKKKCFGEGKEAELKVRSGLSSGSAVGTGPGRRDSRARWEGASMDHGCRLGVLSGALDGGRWCHSLLQGAQGWGGRDGGFWGQLMALGVHWA